MKDKKHIDELFKDRFKNFEVSPSPEVWNSIEATLNKRKKDRKIIPLWWKLGGVAALLALLFTIGNSVFGPSEDNKTIVNSEETTLPIENTDNDPLLQDNKGNSSVVSSENDLQEDIPSDDTQKLEEKSSEAIYNNNNTPQERVAVETKSSEEVNTIKKEAETNRKDLIKDPNEIIDAKKEAVAVVSETKKNSEKTNTDAVENKKESIIKKDLDIAETEKTKSIIAKNDSEEKKIEDRETEVVKTEVEKLSILDAIKEQEAIESKETVAVVKNKIDRRWEVAPNFAPVYYNSLSSGSSIDPSFSDNSQNGDVNFSYGVQVSYALSERLSLRSGVSNVDLSYATSGIELGTGPVSNALKSVNYGNAQVVLTAVDAGALATQNPNGGFGQITPKATSGEAQIIQNISYYEVPLELKYSLLNRKFGINLIGGLSTLFLGNNDVSVEAGDFQSTLGEANNLTSVSFATNVGLGFDYKLSKKFKFNIEPMFKYQLNPYTDSSVNFRPYYIGVYTGLSYKF